MIKVAFLTTWGSKCGISTYSEELCECLINTGEVNVQVIAPMEEGSCIDSPEQIPFRLIWSRNDPNLPISIPPTVQDCDIVHVQHEYGLFQHHDSFIHLLKLLRKNKLKVAVTLHTVFPYGDWRSGVVDSIKSNSDVIITHTLEAYAAILLGRGGAKTIKINHGTRSNVLCGDRAEGIKFLGIPSNYSNASFGGVIGFIGPSKNIHETIRAWSDATARRLIDPSKSGLIIVGETDDNSFAYRKQLGNYKRDCGFSENIFIVDKFIPRNMMKHVMAVFDYAILNTDSKTLSASGQVHALAAHGVPFAAVTRPIYRDSIVAGAVPFNIDDKNEYTISMVNAISALASNKSFREEIKQSLISYAKNTGWPKQAKLHVDVYRELLA